MVLNPRQQNQVRALAGFDVFAGAGIPNYPNASASPKLATGGIAGAGLQLQSQPVIVRPNFTVQVHGVAVTEQVSTYIESDEGMRQQETILKKNYDLRRK
jgi:hypothetical protein